MSDNNRSGDDDRTPKKGGEFRVPPRTWLVWIAIFGGIIVLMLFKDRMESPGDVLSQYQFQEMVNSNLIAQATISYNPQNSALNEIAGKYYKDADHKVAVPFRARVKLYPELEKKLLSQQQFEPREPNTMLFSFMVSVLPII